MAEVNDDKSLLIRADAGGELGTGHVMRMIALAQAWQDRGGDVVLAACSCPAPLIERLERENIRHEAIDPADPGGGADRRALRSLAGTFGCHAVVLDGYQFDSSYQAALREAGLHVLAVDDYGHCDRWKAQTVLNQNLHAPDCRERYEEGNTGVGFLLGPRFALLRREFAGCRKIKPATDDGIRRVLVTFGGVDPGGATLEVLEAMEEWGNPELEIRVIAGAGNSHVDEIRTLLQRSALRVELFECVEDMSEQYAWCDGVITAGGSSSYEWLRFGRPAWVASVAPNQDPVIEALRSRGLAHVAGRFGEVVASGGLAANLREWRETARAPEGEMVDGWGASRVAAVLAGSPVEVRPVNPDSAAEARLLFELANDEVVRAAGFHREPIPWDDHIRWLRHHGANPGSRLFMIERPEHGFAGLVRMHARDRGDWEIGVSVDRGARGAGVAKRALPAAMRELERETEVRRWLATIRPGNEASGKLFRALGFTLVGEGRDRGDWARGPLD